MMGASGPCEREHLLRPERARSHARPLLGRLKGSAGHLHHLLQPMRELIAKVDVCREAPDVVVVQERDRDHAAVGLDLDEPWETLSLEARAVAASM